MNNLKIRGPKTNQPIELVDLKAKNKNDITYVIKYGSYNKFDLKGNGATIRVNGLSKESEARPALINDEVWSDLAYYWNTKLNKK